MAARDPCHVVMLGTDPGTHGGISSVVAAWRAGGLFERWPLAYIVSHRVRYARAEARRGGAGPLRMAAPRLPQRTRRAARACGLALELLAQERLHGLRAPGRLAGRLPPARRRLRPFPRRSRAPRPRGRALLPRPRRGDRRALRSAGPHGCRASRANPRIVCLPNPVALAPPTPVAREPNLVAFAGRCEEAKGIYDLVDAVSRLRPVCPRLRVECAGDGDMARLRRRAFELGVGPQVTMRGWIGAREREALLARATVFVLPSHAEALPMSLLEAMAAGCAVIATRVGGIPDLVRDGENGLLVTPGCARRARRRAAAPAPRPRARRAPGRTSARHHRRGLHRRALHRAPRADLRGPGRAARRPASHGRTAHAPGDFMNRPVVLVLGPHRAAVSGVSTHVNLLMESALGDDFELVHFQVGAEGRAEGAIARALRLLVSPFALAAAIVFRHASVVHINTSLNPRAYWRDLAYLFVATRARRPRGLPGARRSAAAPLLRGAAGAHALPALDADAAGHALRAGALRIRGLPRVPARPRRGGAAQRHRLPPLQPGAGGRMRRGCAAATSSTSAASRARRDSTKRCRACASPTSWAWTRAS